MTISDWLNEISVKFDELGFVPTTLTDEKSEHFIEWFATEISEIKKEEERLKAENKQLKQTLSKMETVEKELKARLEKAVELPCKVGDTVYSVFKFPNEKTVLKGTCKHININICSGFPEIFIKLVFETNEQLFLRTYSGNDLNNIFLLRSEAEARLAELRKGEKE